GHINEGMPRFVVEKVTDALNVKRKAIHGSRIHVLGVAYKPGVNDIRESPALNVMRLLRDKGAVLSYSDPYVPALREDGFALDAPYLRARDGLAARLGVAYEALAAHVKELEQGRFLHWKAQDLYKLSPRGLRVTADPTELEREFPEE